MINGPFSPWPSFTEEEAEVILSKITEASTNRQDSTPKNLLNIDASKHVFSSDKFIEILKNYSTTSENICDLEFDDSDEYIIEEEALDFTAELNDGTWIQQASATLLIDAARSGISDIHIEPRREDYKVRARQDGVMQGYASIPRTTGIQLTACLKNMAQMDISERRASQDGKIRRNFEGQTIEIRCATAPGKFGEKMVMILLMAEMVMILLLVVMVMMFLKLAKMVELPQSQIIP